MRENTELGTNGNFGLNAGMKRGEVLGANFNISHRGNSFSVFAEYAYLQMRNVRLWNNGFYSRNQTVNFKSNTDRNEFSQSHQFRAGIEKTFHENTHMAAYFNLNRTDKTFVGEGISTLQAEDALILGDIWYRELRNNNNRGAHFHISHQLHAKHRFRMDYDWVYLQLDNPTTYDNTLQYNQDTTKFTIDLDSHTPMNFQVASLAYQFQPAAPLNIKAGVKKTWMNFENSLQSYRDLNGTRQFDPFFSNLAQIEENISAAYINGDWQISDYWQVKAGLRFEHTITDMRLIEEGKWDTIYRNYKNIFPNLMLQKKLTEKATLILGYSRRINRPSLNDLVPLILLINQNTHFIGNPSLLPGLIDNYKLDFKYNRMSLSFEHSNTKNAIAPYQPRFDPEQELLIMSPENLRFLQNTGLFSTRHGSYQPIGTCRPISWFNKPVSKPPIWQ
ncbi:MAG: TonB-dependent receptor [Cyclobacteriaceae bacterium]